MSAFKYLDTVSGFLLKLQTQQFGLPYLVPHNLKNTLTVEIEILALQDSINTIFVV